MARKGTGDADDLDAADVVLNGEDDHEGDDKAGDFVEEVEEVPCDEDVEDVDSAEEVDFIDAVAGIVMRRYRRLNLRLLRLMTTLSSARRER